MNKLLPAPIADRHDAGSRVFENKADQVIIENLVTALISVNSWGLDRTCAIHVPLHQQGLFDLRTIQRLSEDDVADRLLTAGYTKAIFVRSLLAKRIKRLPSSLEPSLLSKLSLAIRKHDLSEIRAILKPLFGFGPVVIRNFVSLSGLK